MAESKFLALDCGNTRIKATLLSGGAPERLVFNYDDIESLAKLAGSEDVGDVAMSAVGRVDVRLVETLRQAAGDRFLLLTPRMEMPIGIQYDNPAALGLDRKVACVAGAKLYPGERLLIIDAGTALTKDVVGQDGDFRGGSISPGLRMRFESLHAGTHLLPDVSPDGEEEIRNLGRSTRGSLLAGAAGGLLDEVEAAIRREGRCGATRVLFCGGDGEWVMNHLDGEELGGMKLEYHPDLIAIGLREIYRHHEENL